MSSETVTVKRRDLEELSRLVREAREAIHRILERGSKT